MLAAAAGLDRPPPGGGRLWLVDSGVRLVSPRARRLLPRRLWLHPGGRWLRQGGQVGVVAGGGYG